MNRKAVVQRSFSNRVWYATAKWSIRIGAALAWGVRHSGIRNVPPSGPLLVVANHQSHLDPPLIGSGFPRRLNYMARKSLFHFGPFGWLIGSLDAIPVDRETSPIAGIRETLRRLQRNEALLMFPEGSRCWDGEVGPFLPGFALIAKRCTTPVLPAAIEGAFRTWPRWKSLPGRGTIHVHFGPPISPEEITSMTQEQLMDEAGKRIRQCLALLRTRSAFARRSRIRHGDSPQRHGGHGAGD